MKKISLELGGKSPNIVFADADLEKFARESPYSVFDNTGQDCCARSRILVERSAHDQVVELVRRGDAAVERRRPGRRRDRGRHARQLQAARPRQGLHRDRARRGRDDRRRRRGARRTRRWPTARTSCRRSSTASTTTCASPARRSSARSCRSSRSTPRRRRSGSRTRRRTGCRGSIWSRDIGKALRAAQGAPGRGHLRQLELVGPHRGAVRRLQDVGHRPRARDVGARPLHRDQERLHRPELSSGPSIRRSTFSWEPFRDESLATRRDRRRLSRRRSAMSSSAIVPSDSTDRARCADCGPACHGELHRRTIRPSRHRRRRRCRR